MTLTLEVKKPRISKKLRQAIEIRVRKGATILAACEEAGLSPAGWYKAMQRPAVVDLLQEVQNRFVSEVSAGSAHRKARALKVAEDLMHNARSENVRARMAEFLAGDGKSPQVAVHVDARSTSRGYEMVRPGQRVVEMRDSSGNSVSEIVDQQTEDLNR
ncbi:hypothetical protein [Yoonia litorea]|uniref:Uncharacterized protein n=1 Tax=Yoonia litorea TaxID=1123755 RepID=A0A1I6L586_9RHOB|nr:hypothetical protein [Yoonia litorea]SFR98438.1 hypothetical protein SAMN05444714_0181 [Yoonia litorea]